MLTPHIVRYGLAAYVFDNRQGVLTVAFQQHSERFVRKPPRPAPLPDAAWINPPVRRGEAKLAYLCGRVSQSR
jgi:putative transposase